MLAINPLLVVLFANISSHSGSCLFILLIVSFAVKTLFRLIRSNLFVFVLITFRSWIKKKLLQFMPKSALPTFSSRSFIESNLIFRSLTHFEFIFIYDVGEYSNYIILHVAAQFYQQHLLNSLSFPLYILVYLKATGCTLLSSTHETFFRTDHMLSHKTSLGKFKKT